MNIILQIVPIGISLISLGFSICALWIRRPLVLKINPIEWNDTGEIYNKTRIEQAVDHAIGLKRNVNADEGMITKDAYQWLKTHASDKRSGTKKKAVMDDEHIQIRDELLNN